MQINEVMTTGVRSVNRTTPLVEVAKMMRDENFGAVPVVENEEVVGMVTDRDMVIRAGASGRDFNTVQVADVMTEDILTCHEDDSVEDVARLMSRNQVRRIPVVDLDQHLLGMVSLKDLAVENETEDLAQDALSEISEDSSGRASH